MKQHAQLFDYWRSSASYRVRIALALADIDFQSTAINLLDGEQRSTTHLQRNAQGLVPVLEIDGITLTQSLAIIEYLNETRDLGLLGENAETRARIRAVSYAVAMEIHPICNLRVAKYATQASAGAISNEAWMQHFIRTGLADLEPMLGDGDYCVVERVSLADICLVPQVYNALRWQIDLNAFPAVQRIYKHLNTLEAFQRAHPDQCAR